MSLAYKQQMLQQVWFQLVNDALAGELNMGGLLPSDMFKRQSSAEASINSYKSTEERQQRISFDIFELM